MMKYIIGNIMQDRQKDSPSMTTKLMKTKEKKEIITKDLNQTPPTSGQSYHTTSGRSNLTTSGRSNLTTSGRSNLTTSGRSNLTTSGRSNLTTSGRTNLIKSGRTLSTASDKLKRSGGPGPLEPADPYTINLDNMDNYFSAKVIDEMINIKSIKETVDGVLTISEKELNDIFGPVYQAPDKLVITADEEEKQNPCSGLKEYGYEELEEMLKIKDQFLQIEITADDLEEIFKPTPEYILMRTLQNTVI
ncbi:uncharacterized protein LOC111707166 isoform X2 [Eurytemora carolleeae]|uniref:uncharacterized protein LOC111707166 isoform X2 n=1 Tax=Eurytemora carolleeae TaxID=1294199 RepID=UPI000C77FD0E|nr:uncharacterized protein LOC111707166 isoform X2 [Eurytemora carolleeae]|eukprot:XP_023335985.1 uncharacterized protein LOC111707166 isoform X2 [Eurytemora affinis]